MTLEKYIEAKFCEIMTAQGNQALKLRIDGRKGFPDRTILVPEGRAFFIEFKRPGGKLSPQQVAWIDELRRLGFRAESCDNVSDALKIYSEVIR